MVMKRILHSLDSKNLKRAGERASERERESLCVCVCVCGTERQYITLTACNEKPIHLVYPVSIGVKRERNLCPRYHW